MLADLAVNDPQAFTKLVEVAQQKLNEGNAKVQANA